jgi:hypothetical protein
LRIKEIPGYKEGQLVAKNKFREMNADLKKKSKKPALAEMQNRQHLNMFFWNNPGCTIN